MATNIVTYIGNLGKSVGYSAVDKFKKMAPTTAELVTTNAELYKTVYASVRDYKNTFKRTTSTIQSSNLYEAGNEYVKALFEDISTGKLYNKEREDKFNARALGMDDFSGGDDEWASMGMSFDDSAFDINEDDMSDFGDFSDGEKAIVDSVEKTSKANSNAVSMAIARTGEYVVENQRMQTQMLYSQNLQAFGNMNSSLTAINDNIGKMLDFSSQTIQTHAQNSQKYYETTTALMLEQRDLLKQIAAGMAIDPKEEKKNNKITFEDIIGTTGAPDIKKYLQQVKKNFANITGQFMPNMDFGGGGNVLLTFASQPLKPLVDALVNKVVPTMVEETIGEFDKSLGGLFGGLMAKANTAKRSDNFLMQKLGELFGVSNILKNDIDSSQYNKGKVNWDGKSKKALEEVIPTHLARIESLLSGQTEKRFDYDQGKFVDAKSIKDTFESKKKSYAKKSSSDMREEFSKYMDLITFTKLQDKEEFDKDVDRIFEYLFNTNEIFDINNKDFDSLAYKYGVDKKNLRLFRSLFKNSSRSAQTNLNRNIMSNREARTNEMLAMEEKGSVYSNLFNGIDLNEFVNINKNTGKVTSKGIFGKNNLLDTLDEKGHNIFYYMRNINTELSFMRKNGFGGGPNGPLPDIIDSKGNRLNLSNKFENEKIKDDSKPSDTRLYNDSRERANKSFIASQERAREKDSFRINASEIYDNEKDYENALDRAIHLRQIENKVKEEQNKQKNKKPDMIESLLEADSLVKKYQVLKEKGSNILKKPMDFLNNVFKKADQHIYEMIYGTEGNEKGFMGLLIERTKQTFNKFNSWLDDTILQPLKDRLKIESFKDLGNKFLGMFGLDAKEMKENLHNYFFHKDTGLFTGIANGFKETFGSVKKTVFGAVKGTWNDLTKPFKDKFKSRKKAFKEMEEEEIAEEQSSINDINDETIKESINESSNELNSNKEDKDKKISEKNNPFRELMNKIGLERLSDSRVDELFKKFSNNKKDIKSATLNDIVDLFEKDGTITTKNGKTYRKYNKDRSILDVISNYKNGLKDKDATLRNILNTEFAGDYEDDNKEEAYDPKRLLAFTENQQESTNYLKDIRDFLFNLKDEVSNTQGRNRGKNQRRISRRQNNLGSAPVFDPNIDNAENNIMWEQSSDLAKMIMEFMTKKFGHHKKGSQVLDRAQIATLKEGELVLNPDEVKSIASLLRTFNNKITGADENTKLSDIASGTYKRFSNVKKSSGVNFKDLDGLKDRLKEAGFNLDEISRDAKDKLGRILNVSEKQYALDTGVDEKGKPLDPMQRALYEDVKPFVFQMLDEAKNGFNSVKKSLFGEPKDEQKAWDEAIKDVSGNISEYAPKMLPASLIGGGVSLLTGAIGGPLLGAAVGAGASLVMNSDKLQTYLFGDKIDDETGERTGGLINKSIIDSFQKYFPDAGKYGLTGALAGMITPLGPVGGLLLGAGASFAKNNVEVQNFLFGEQGLIKPENKEKLKKALPKIGLGVLAGTMFGPFGLVGNALLGAGAGFATTSSKFNEAILGKYNPTTGRNENGILPAFRESLIDPLVNFGPDMKVKFFEFMEKSIFDPIKTAIDPLKKDAKLFINGFFRVLGSAFEGVFKRAWDTPLGKMMDSITKKVLGGLKGTGKALLSPIKGIATFGANKIAQYGDLRRRKHVLSGNADYMTAQERLEYYSQIKDKGILSSRQRQFGQLDEFLSSADSSSIADLQNVMQQFGNLNKSDKDINYSIGRETADKLAPYMGTNSLSKVLKMYKNGADINDILAIKNQGISESKNNILKIKGDEKTEGAFKYYQKQIEKIYSNAESKGLSPKEIERQKVHLRDDIKKRYLKAFPAYVQKQYLDQIETQFDKGSIKDGGEANFDKFVKDKFKEVSNSEVEVDKIITEQYDKLGKFRNNKQNKNQVISNLNEQLRKMGINVDLSNPKDIEKITNLVNKEADRIKAENSLLNNEETVENEQEILSNTLDWNKMVEEENKKRHNRIVDLFTATINTVREVNGLEKIPFTTHTQDSEATKTVSKILKTTNKKAILRKNEDRVKLGEEDNNGIIHSLMDDGSVIQLRRESNGDIIPNTSDANTKASIFARAKDKIKNYSFFEKMTGFFSKKDKDDEEGGEKKKGLLDTIFGFLGGGIGSKVGLVLGAAAIGKLLKVTGLGDTIKDKVIPWIGDTLTKAAPMFANLIVEGIKAAIPLLFSTVSELAKTTAKTLLPEIFQEDDPNKEAIDNSVLGNGIVRTAIKGNTSAFTKVATKTAMKPGKVVKEMIKHPILGTAKNTVQGTTHGIAKVGEFVSKGVNKVTSPINKSAFLKKNKYNIYKKTKDVVNTVVSDESVIGTYIKKMQNWLVKLLQSGAVKKLLGDKADDLVQKFVPKLTMSIGEQMAKNSTKIAAKVASISSTGGLALIAFAVTDFVSGYNDALNIWGVTETDDFDLGIGYKVAAGIMKAINGAFLVTSFIPEKLYVDLILDTVLPIFGIENTKIQQQRKNTENEIAKYNKENGTSYDIREYNANVKGHKTIGKKIKDSFGWVGDNAKKAASWVGDKAKKAGSWVGDKLSEAGSWVGDKASGVYQSAKNWANEKIQNAKNSGKAAAEWIKPLVDSFEGMVGRVNEKIKKFFTDKFITPIMDGFNKFKDKLFDGFNKFKDNIIKPISKSIESIKTKFITFGTWLKDTFVQPVVEVVNWVKEKFDIKGKVEKVVNKVNDVKQNVSNKVTEVSNKVYNSYQGTKQKITSGISNFANSAKNKAINAMNSIGGSYEDNYDYTNNNHEYYNKYFTKGKKKYTGIGGEYVSEDQLSSLGWKNPGKSIGDLNSTLTKFHIDSDARIKHFLAQCAHESGYGQYTKELADGSAYEGRTDLGNTQSGDGRKYKGAGFIQVTGRSNYQDFANAIGDSKVMDGVNYVSEKYPWSSAGYWWQKNGLNTMVDNGADVKQVTKRVNGGYNGLQDRLSAFSKVSNVLNGLPATGSTDTSVSGSGVSSSSESSSSGNILDDAMNIFGNAMGRMFGTGDTSSSSTSGSLSMDGSSINIENAPEAIKKAVQYAVSKVGCPYVWGFRGEKLTEAVVSKFKNSNHDITSKDGANDGYKKWIGKEGYDCSGLMQAAYKAAGVSIGSTTYEQVKNGKSISESELQPGDLMFYGSPSSPTHVAMYLGDNKMVHAPESGKTVCIVQKRANPSACRRIIEHSEVIQTSGISTTTSDSASANALGDSVGGARKTLFKFRNNKKNVGGEKLANKFFSNTLKGNVTSNFGFRNTTGTINKNHTGIDIGAQEGQDIISPVGGTVVSKKPTDKSNGLGNLLVLKDKLGGEHMFGHMKNPSNLKPGDNIKAGDKVGNIGTTGNSTGPHLHYETRVNGNPVDPNQYYDGKNIGGERDNTSLGNNDTVALLKTIVQLLTNISQNTLNINTLVQLVQAIKGNGNSQIDSTKQSEISANTKQSLREHGTKLNNMIGKQNNNSTNDQDLYNILAQLATY